MERPTVLRISRGTKLTPEMVKGLIKLIGPFGKPLEFENCNNVKHATYERMMALKEAFTFMLGVKGCNQVNLVSFAQTSADILFKEIEEISDENTVNEISKKALGRYAVSLIDILSRKFGLKPKEAKKQLNRAEQYYLLAQKRPKVATISPITGKSGHFLLQYDKPIQAFTKKTIDELEHIKEYAAKHERYIPILPEWFYDLSPAIKIYILKSKARHLSDTEIRKNLNSLLNAWKLNIDELNEETQRLIKAFAITKNKVLLPKWLQELPEVSQQLLSDLYAKESTPFDLLSQIECVGSSIPGIEKLPAWYFFLEDFERGQLVSSLNLIKDLCEVSLSSRLRSLPGLANAGVHSSFIMKMDGTIVRECSDRFRAGHLVSRDNRNWPLSLQGDYISENLALLPKKPELHVTTLISPHDSSWARTKVLTNVHPDSWLNYLLQILFRSMAKVEFVNLPVNYYGGALLSWQNDLPQKINAYLNKIKEKNNNEVKQKIADLEPLLNEARNLLNYEVEYAPWNAVNLRLAAIFHLLGQRLGVSFGSCVSGKDRYAVLLTYTNAMVVYNSIYGHWPAFKHGKNYLFNRLLMKILKTNHQATLANLNAWGSRGLKNLSDYLNVVAGNDDKGWLEEQNLMASANELKIIFKQYPYQDGIGEHLFKSIITIGSDNCSKLNEKIYAIVQEKEFWKAESSRGIPEGVFQLQQIFSASPISQDILSSIYNWATMYSTSKNVKDLTQAYKSRSPILVFSEVLGAIKQSNSRAGFGRGKNTRRFYDIFKPYIETEPLSDVEKTLNTLQKLDKFFEEIKKNTNQNRNQYLCS